MNRPHLDSSLLLTFPDNIGRVVHRAVDLKIISINGPAAAIMGINHGEPAKETTHLHISGRVLEQRETPMANRPPHASYQTTGGHGGLVSRRRLRATLEARPRDDTAGRSLQARGRLRPRGSGGRAPAHGVALRRPGARGRAGEKPKSPATRGWEAFSGVSGLAIRDGKLVGRTTDDLPLRALRAHDRHGRPRPRAGGRGPDAPVGRQPGRRWASPATRRSTARSSSGYARAFPARLHQPRRGRATRCGPTS